MTTWRIHRPAIRGLTTRLGVIALFSSAVVALLGTAVATLNLPRETQQFAWLAACALVAMCGLMNVRGNRAIGRIEAELMRCAADRRRWQAARPLIGQGALIESWNDLLGFAEQRESPVAASNDADEDAALILRAYRSFPIAIAVTDESGVVLKHNPALAMLLGEEASASLTYRSMRDLLQLDGRPEEAARLFSGARSISIQLKRGTDIHAGVWRVSRSRLQGRPSDAPANVWWLEDVTQSALAADARDQFLATATHELRTPLGNLRAYAEALVAEQGVDVEQQKEFCNIINDECTRLARLVDQLLAVDQLEAGSLVLHRGEVEFSRVVREALDHVRSSAESKQQTLRVDVSPKLPLVVGDKDKLQAMLVNLLGNAIKYTQEGGEIELLATCATSGRIDVTVADNGPGIAADELPRIFDKFFRSRDPKIASLTGNGLGLTFAREIIRLHGGEIQVESQVGEGTRFVLHLPAKPTPHTP